MAAHKNRLRKKRSERKHRKLKLGRYLIVTDARGTEPNYFEGIRKDIPTRYRGDIEIKICADKDIDRLIDFAKEERSRKIEYSNVWLIFDKDEYPRFDKLILDAQKGGMNVGWSNPCFEIWLHAYFGKMPNSTNSKECCSKFEKDYCKETDKSKYIKSDKSLYVDLQKHGDEMKAIIAAERRHKESKKNYSKPSEMTCCTTVYKLVREIRSKTPVE